MNLFRSGEHVRQWYDGQAAPEPVRSAGRTLPVSTLSALAHAWWGDRLSPAWVPHTREQNQAVLDGLGLVGEFWALP